ncbi:MAG: NAD(+)/NADH kinase [Fervidicoccaceae archaeon]
MRESCEGAAVFINPESNEAVASLEILWKEAKEIDLNLFVAEESLNGREKEINLPVFPLEKIKPCWSIIVGGDGTLLKAVRFDRIRNSVIATVGSGRRCYYFDITTRDIEGLLKRLVKRNFIEQHLWMLEAKGDGFRENFLNEIVIHGGSIKVIELRISINGDELYRLAGDGVIIATSSGSTAYSLSAGGPIVDPLLSSIVITPLSSMSLHARPIVVDPFSTIEVEVLKRTGKERMIVDGQVDFPVPSKVGISLNEVPLRIARVRWMRFYERVLRGKCSNNF